jgi:hypothetical protein
MKSLKERWLQADGKLLHDAVLSWLSSGSDIATVGLSKHQDRWDLRGIALPNRA